MKMLRTFVFSNHNNKGKIHNFYYQFVQFVIGGWTVKNLKSWSVKIRNYFSRAMDLSLNLTDYSAVQKVSTKLAANNRRDIVVLCLLIVGVAGNFSALLILLRKKYSNSKYTLMLKWVIKYNFHKIWWCVGIFSLLQWNEIITEKPIPQDFLVFL